jgi:hypothetical protein
MSEPILADGDYFFKRTAESDVIDDGYEVFCVNVDGGEESRELVAVVDTESMADVLMRYLTGNNDPHFEFQLENWYGPC